MSLRLAPALSAFLLSVSLAVAAPAIAAGGHYRAEFATPPPSGKLVARDVVWTCDSGTCTAATSNSRPEIVCSALARRFGALSSFTVAGRPLDAADLEKCNAKAR